jgi:hypothetical protein
MAEYLVLLLRIRLLLILVLILLLPLLPGVNLQAFSSPAVG